MSSMIEQLLQEAREEIGLDKNANDQNGAPDQASNNAGQAGQDIISTAQAFLQQVEQFKATMQTGAAGQDPNAQVDPNAQQVDPNAQQQVDPNAQQVAGGITVQTPGGSVVKIASLIKLSSLFSKKD